MSALFLKGLSQKVRRGQAGSVRQGRNPGGDLYGYTPRKGKPGILDINPETSAVVTRVFEEYAAGTSPRAIAARLNAENVLPLAVASGMLPRSTETPRAGRGASE
ncbi:recombinase family protein [Bradyrhizobium guangdongense]